ncbi:hypothetical protein K1719_038726 [Acacia pycnantha]|nr:hypothetical protein K1719_038726 [Acacia pycnantha]
MEDRNYKVRSSSSEFPEKVLSHILSFLPTKEAVRTSVLSKRWEYIWTSIPKLRFHHHFTEPSMDFVNIIDRLLRLRGSYDITSFSLYIDIFTLDFEVVDITSKVEAWLSAVVGFNVKDVELSLDGFNQLTLPFSFVNCRTLTSLIIFAAAITLKFPSPVCFFNLKKLVLSRVTLPDEHSTQKLFSGCPLLEDFKLEECDWNDLKCFHYEGECQFEFNILNSHLLEEVHINLYSLENGPINVINHFLKLLRYACDVPNLTLRNSLCVLVVPEVATQIPMFNGVRLLQLDYETSDLSNKGLLMVLQNIPFLESLLFVEGIKMSSDPIEDNILDPLPPCFIYSLHFIHVYIKKGDDNELMGVKVLLENAMALVEMSIEFSTFVNKDGRNNFCVELLKLPRGSRYCGIYISG